MTETKQTLEKSFTITRIFDAPRAEIWRAWTDPDEAATWWHPRGVETPRDSVEIDARPGGTYRYTMIAPDGSTYRRSASTARSSSPSGSASRGPTRATRRPTRP